LFLLALRYGGRDGGFWLGWNGFSGFWDFAFIGGLGLSCKERVKRFAGGKEYERV